MQPTRHCHCALSCPFSSSDMSSPASTHCVLTHIHTEHVQRALEMGEGIGVGGGGAKGFKNNEA